jgi:energy-coupling factor transporter ATP-binding protein EcfA2
MWLEHLTTSVLNRIMASRGEPPPNGLFLGRSVDSTRRAVVLAEQRRCEHLVVVGKTGTGKTHLLEHLAIQVAQRGEGLAFFDFHGDVSLSLIDRLAALPGAEGRLIILDPSHPMRSPGMNVLEVGADTSERFRKVSELSAILRQRWGVDSFGARTEELLRNSLYTLACAQGTLAHLPGLLTSAPVRRSAVAQVDHPDIRAYWADRYEPLSEAMKGAFREPLLNKVTGFLADPAARHLLGQPTSTVDITQSMQAGQWIIVRLPKGRLREHAHTLGNLLFAQFQFAAMSRDRFPPAGRRTFTLLCDEVQNLAENDLATLLTEGRKFGISLITANQFWDQLSRELRGALLSANAHVCFRTSSADAQILAGELSLGRRHNLAVDLTELRRGEAIGSLRHGDVVHFRVPALPRCPEIAAVDLERLIETVAPLRIDIERAISAPADPVPQLPLVVVDEEVREAQHDWS